MNITGAFEDLMDKVEGWVHGFIAMLPNLVAAILILVAFRLISRVARNLTDRGMSRVSDNEQISRLLANVVGTGVLLTGIFVALGVLQLDKTVASLLAGVGIVGLALGFAFQDIAANFISGVLLAMRRPFRTGDLISSNDQMGVVDEVNLRSTRIRLFSGELAILPNKEVFQNVIVNHSQPGGRRVEVPVGVSYGDDLEAAEQAALKAAASVSSRDESKEPMVVYTGFGGSSIDMEVRLWVKDTSQPSYLKARSEAIKAIKREFDAAGISIPFPIRTLDFGIEGGATLAEMLHNGQDRGASPN